LHRLVIKEKKSKSRTQNISFYPVISESGPWNWSFFKAHFSLIQYWNECDFSPKNWKTFVQLLSSSLAWFDIENGFRVYKIKNVTLFFVIDCDFEEFKGIFFIILCFFYDFARLLLWKVDFMKFILCQFKNPVIVDSILKMNLKIWRNLSILW